MRTGNSWGEKPAGDHIRKVRSRRSRNVVRSTLAVGAAAAMALGVTGCGSNDDGSGGGGGGSAAGDGPIKIMSMYRLSGTSGLYQPWSNAAKAAVDEVNAAGGINGRKIELTSCDLGITPNKELACGRQAVKEKVVGVVSFAAETAYLPLLERAKIPNMDIQVGPKMSTSPVSFGLVNVPQAATFGLASLAKVEGCKKVATVVSNPGAPALTRAFIKGFVDTAKKLGVGGDVIMAPVNSTDYSSYLTQALKGGTDCLGLQAFAADEVNLVKTAGTTVPANIKLLTATSYIDPASLKSMGPAADRLIVTGATAELSDTDNLSIKQFKAAVDKYSAKPKGYDSNSIASWAMTRALLYGVSQVKGDVTAEAVLNALNGVKDYNAGVVPPVSFNAAPPGAPGPRNFPNHAQRATVKNGQVVTEGKWIDTYTGQAQSVTAQGPDTLAESTKK